MKTLKCPNCGAMVNANAKKCDYCNTTFETTELKSIDTVEPNKTTKMPELTEQELVANLKNYLQSNNSMLAIIPLIIFLIAWISIGLTMAGNWIWSYCEKLGGIGKPFSVNHRSESTLSNMI